MFNKKTKGKNMAQDENKIYQIIYTDETGENTEQIEWTLDNGIVKGFKNMIFASDSINNYYQTDPDAFKFITDTETEKLCDGDRVEKWRKCKSSDEICKRNGITGYKIQASNFGRIRLYKNSKDIKICPLYDRTNMNEPINSEVFAKLKKSDVGYLIAKIPRTEHFFDLYAYRLVADAWLKGYKCYESIGDIHHITNDGYYNRPENLVFLSNWHSFIHNGNKGQAEKYNPKKSLNRSIL